MIKPANYAAQMKVSLRHLLG